MKLKVLPHYVLVFAVRGKRKIGTFYTPTKGSFSDYNAVQPVWMAEFGKNCRILWEGVDVGSKGFIHDVYDLEDLPEYFWETYKGGFPPSRVAEIEKEVKTTDGFITANIVHEDSIFAVEEECHAERG